MKKENIIGSFVFRNEGDGCLTSKFRNNVEQRPLTECSRRISNDVNLIDFEGEYDTVWPQDDGEAILRIERVENTNQFNLKWLDSDNVTEIKFYGHGMLFEKLLVGSYWNQEVEDLTRAFDH